MNNKFKKLTIMQISLLLIVLMTVGGTVAFLTAAPKTATNTFTPTAVSCNVTETFDGTAKSNVNVENTGNTDAYVRVKLVTYRVMDINGKDERIGGSAVIPEFTPGTDWVKGTDGFYYYTKLVAPGEKPATPLIGTPGINLVAYTDVDGGRQVIDVIAEAIQPQPQTADKTQADTYNAAWAVTQ